jgi:hypothetical protein
MTFNIGDKVRVLPPFAANFSGEYTVLALAAAPDTYSIDIYGDGIGSDFSSIYLEAA